MFVCPFHLQRNKIRLKMLWIVQIHMWEYESPAELLQFIMNLLATTCSCGIHSYIAIRIVANYDKVTQYRSFVVAQSTVFFVDSVGWFLLNYVSVPSHSSWKYWFFSSQLMTSSQVYTEGGLKYGLPFLSLSPQGYSAVTCVLRIVLQMEIALLSIFNIYRTTVIMRREDFLLILAY